MHEELAGKQADDIVGRDTAVRTPDPEKLGKLLLEQTLEELRVRRYPLVRPATVIGEQRGEIARFRTQDASSYQSSCNDHCWHSGHDVHFHWCEQPGHFPRVENVFHKVPQPPKYGSGVPELSQAHKVDGVGCQ